MAENSSHGFGSAYQAQGAAVSGEIVGDGVQKLYPSNIQARDSRKIQGDLNMPFTDNSVEALQ